MINYTTATNGNTTKTFKNPTPTRSRFNIFKYLSVLLIMGFLGIEEANAQLGSYSAGATSASGVVSNITFGTLARGSGVVSATATGYYVSSNWDATDRAGARTNNEYHGFSVQANNTYTATYTSFTYTGYRTSAGPTVIGAAYSTDGGSNWTESPDLALTNAATDYTTTWDFTDFATTNNVIFRVYGWSASGTGNLRTKNFVVNGSVSGTCTTPTVQTSIMTTNSIATTSSNYAFTRGNGTAGVLVVARPTSSAAVAPTSGSTYTANASYGSGSTTGTNNNVVYNSTANGVSTATGNLSITGLTAGTQYTITAYEYNTTSTCYNTTSPASVTFYTLCVPPATNTPSTVGSKSFTATWGSVTGASSYQLDVSTASDFSSFVSGYNSLSVAGTSQTVTGLNYNTTYYFRVRAVNAESTASANSNTSSTQTKTAATSLVLVGAPSTGNVGVNLTSFTVEAQRNDATVDDAYTSSISITKVSGSGTISGNSAVAASIGSVTFASIQFNTADTYTISATDGTLTSATSGNIVITPVTLASDYFRSNSGNTGSGATLATASNWQSSSDNSTWITATSAPTSAANTITIRSGHNISIGSSITLDQLVIEAGATLTNSSGLIIANGFGTDLTVAGTLTNSSSLSISSGANVSVSGTLTQTVSTSITTTGTIAFTSTGIYNHQINGGTVPTATWDAASNCNITGMIGTSPSGLGQTFGKVTWDCSSQSTFAVMGASGSFNPKGLFTVVNTNNTVIELESAGSGSTYNFDGGLSITGGTFVVNYDGSGTTLVATLNITGNLSITNTGVFDMAQGSGSAASGGYSAIVNLTGDLSINNTSTSYPLQASATNNAGKLNFTGTSQNYYRTSSTGSQYVDYVVSSSSNLTLQNSMLLYSSSASTYDQLTVNGTLTAGANTLSASSGTTARFTIANAGTLVTSNTGGIGTTIGVGGTKTYTAGANYTFNGISSTPFPLGTFGNPATININAAVTSNLAATLVVTTALNINNGGTFTLNGSNNLQLNTGVAMTIAIGGTFDNAGTSQIVVGSGSPTITINGKFITRDLDGFVGSNTTIPSITPTLGASSEIEYAASSGTQIVNAAPSYVNLTITNGGTKSPSSAISVSGTLTINTAAIFDGTSNTIGSATTNLTIIGTGKLIVGGTGTKPVITGTYTLSSNSTIEFSNSAGTTQTIRASIAYTNVSVTGSNVTLPISTSISNLTINTGGYLYLSGNMAVNDLNLTNGKFDIGGYTLTINGIVTRTSGNFVGSASSSLILNGNTNSFGFDQTTPGTTNLLKNLTVSGSGTSTIGNALNITGGSSFGVVTVGSGATLTTGGFLTLQSADLGTACIGTSLGTVSGNITVERYIPANGRRYRFLASPVVGGTTLQWRNNATNVSGRGLQITGGSNASLYDVSTNNSPSAFTYNEANTTGTISDPTKWSSLDGNTTLTNGVGYRVFVRGDRSIDLTTLNSTNNVTTISVTGTYPTGTAGVITLPTTYNASGGQGWNLVGNPYPCSIDWNASGWVKTNINDQIAIYRPSTNTYSYYTTTGNVIVNDGSNIIGSGQAFWVKATASPTLTCSEAIKVTSAPPTVLLKSVPSNQLRLKLTQDSSNIDESIIAFGEKFSNDFIETEDVNKLVNATVNISSVVGFEKYAAINFTSNNYTEKVMPLSVWGNTNGQYQLAFSQVEGFDPNVSIFLKDKFLNSITAINQDKQFNIDLADNSKGDNRFELVFKNNGTNVENVSKITTLSVYPNPATDVLNISLSNGTSIETVNIYNVSGKLVNNIKLNGNQIDISQLNNGVYMVEVLTSNGTFKTKFVK